MESPTIQKRLDDVLAELKTVREEIAALRQQPTNPETLNPGDVAKQLAVSPATVIGWIRNGQLRAANVATGTRPRFIIQRAAVDAFLASRQTQPPMSRRRKIQTQSKRY